MHDRSVKGLTTGFILPFATPAANRLRDFTKNMEMAAILYLAESNRKKGESHILRMPDEKLVFVTEVCYPIWLIPYNRATLVFDGLGISSYSLYYDIAPDVTIFNNTVRESQKTAEAYAAALDRNIDHFKNFNGKEEKATKGLIATPDLIKDFMVYFLKMKETKGPFTAKVILNPTIGESEIQTSLKQLSNLEETTNEDIESIDASMKLLSTTTLRRIKALREEIRRTQEKHDKQVKRIKHRVTREIRQIRSKYDRKMIKSSQRFKKRLQRLHKNQIRLQRTLRHLKTAAKQCQIRIQSSKRRKRKQTENQWTLKLKGIKKKLPTIQKEIENTIRRIQNVETIMKLELAQQKTECDTQIEAANKKLLNQQASKEAEITLERQEMKTIEENTSLITKHMHEMVKAKKVALEEFDTIAMPMRKQACTLLYMPFYLVRYEREDKKRYIAYPPSIVSDLGILTKMKGALGAAKVKALLQSRSKAIATFLNRLVTLIEKDPIVEKEVTEASIQESILLTKKLRIGVKKGLKELENENWISKNEHQTLSKLLYTYS